jgi:hypothetical protein
MGDGCIRDAQDKVQRQEGGGGGWSVPGDSTEQLLMRVSADAHLVSKDTGSSDDSALSSRGDHVPGGMDVAVSDTVNLSRGSIGSGQPRALVAILVSATPGDAYVDVEDPL